MWRTVRRGSTRPRRDGRSRKAGRVAGRGCRAAMSSARCARSAAVSSAISRWRSISVSSAATRSRGASPPVSAAPVASSAAMRERRGCCAALRCAAGHRSPEPALEHQVVAGDVVRAAAQGRAARPVHLPRVGEIHLTQCPRVRFDRIRHHWQPRDREGMRESRDPDERVTDVRRHRHSRLTRPAVGQVRPWRLAPGPRGT